MILLLLLIILLDIFIVVTSFQKNIIRYKAGRAEANAELIMFANCPDDFLIKFDTVDPTFSILIQQILCLVILFFRLGVKLL